METFKLFNPDGLELNIATNIEFPQFQAYVFDQTSKRAGKTLQAVSVIMTSQRRPFRFSS